MRPFLKNERGLTLIELLAAIIILSILLLIATPMVGKIIENSRKDAYLADAEMFVYAAKIAHLNDEIGKKATGGGGFAGGEVYTLKYLSEAGYAGNIKHDYDLLRSCVVYFDNKYFIRLFVTNPDKYQVIPSPNAIIKSPQPFQESKYHEYTKINEKTQLVDFNGRSGKGSLALIEDVRGDRDLVRLP